MTTSSAPVSIDFANDHMHVAGATTVDSFTMHNRGVDWMDGCALSCWPAAARHQLEAPRRWARSTGGACS
ncbi:MAG: hypothetical protein ABIX28_23085 [Vicinamibacterales bacterium]